MGPLCVRCGETGHIAKECTGRVLPAWEQSYLKSIVFGDSPQSNFCAFGFGSYDGNVSPYGINPPVSPGYRPEPSSSMIDSSTSTKLSVSNSNSSTSTPTENVSVRSNSVTYGALEDVTMPVICSFHTSQTHHLAEASSGTATSTRQIRKTKEESTEEGWSEGRTTTLDRNVR